MKKFVILAALLAAYSAFADQKKIDLTPDSKKGATKAGEDPGSVTPYVTSSKKKLKPHIGKTAVNVSSSCTDAHGVSYKAGDAGYDSCFGGTGDKSHPPQNTKNNKPSIGISIGH